MSCSCNARCSRGNRSVVYGDNDSTFLHCQCLTCVQVLRVMAMTGAGVEEEGALEAGVAAMSSVLGMQGLPRDQAAVANLMTGMVKAMGSIACLSEV